MRSKYVVLLPITVKALSLNEMVSGYYDIRGGVKKYANTPQYYRIHALPTCCFSLFGQFAVGLNSVRSVVVITSLNDSGRGMKILRFRTFVRNVCVITSPQERVTFVY